MVFKKLPIEFDARGQAKLRAGAPTVGAFAVAQAVGVGESDEHERLLQEAIQSPHIRYFEVEPLTRCGGGTALRVVVDLENRRVLDARAESTEYRGFELILKGRAPSDAVAIASRLSGRSSGANSIAAAMALEMAFGVAPPPLAQITRGLGSSAELIYSHVRHLFLLAGPDYSEATLRRTNDLVWKKAEGALAPNVSAHGYRTIGEIMREMNPISGHLYREALHLTRAAAEVATLIFGRYPHPSTIFPGGIGIEADRELFNQVLGRINRLIDYAKKVAALWDDLVEFFYQADARYLQVGRLPANLISAGWGDDPAAYDARFDHCNDWGEKRLATPGVVVQGQLRTNRLTDLNAGIEAFIDHSFFGASKGHFVKADQFGVPLSPLHPWNYETLPQPAQGNWKEQYSWCVAPRWDREPMETGPIARQWITAQSGKVRNEFILAEAKPASAGSNGSANGAGHRQGRLEISLPKFQTPARKTTWHVPDAPNALERNRARAHAIGYCGMVAFTYLLKAFDCLQRGERRLSEKYTLRKESIGAGFCESGQGMLTHHTLLSGGYISNYQIVPPSAWLSSPHDAFDVPGPFEQAMLNTPLLEEFSRPDDFTGIDLLRAIRSFDP
ncbi:MAG: nickel-dependent hydrogenase large subunit [Blastocatellia bacterium]|nr:nickel-dependent hydrogenase large subunit [Blastocatellia bacterium]